VTVLEAIPSFWGWTHEVTDPAGSPVARVHAPPFGATRIVYPRGATFTIESSGFFRPVYTLRDGQGRTVAESERLHLLRGDRSIRIAAGPTYTFAAERGWFKTGYELFSRAGLVATFRSRGFFKRGLAIGVHAKVASEVVLFAYYLAWRGHRERAAAVDAST
jgi:hypothetical protein